jgi:glyoxylase-like metal-dependent hydrolase (beta-lactamase superfamily II)
MEPLAEAASWFLISESGKALVMDYGYKGGFGVWPPPDGSKKWQWPSYSYRSRRRPLLHGAAALKRQFGIDRIDVAMIGHFHDDHVCGVPMLQRLYGTECWVPENFSELILHPEAHKFPCNWPEAPRIDKVLPLGSEFSWEEYKFRLEPMSGHTRFSVAILFEADGKRFAHTGDQYFFQHRKAPGKDDWSITEVAQNHVYQNGAFLESYRESARMLSKWRPDIIISGHQLPMFTDATFFEGLNAWGEEFEQLHLAAAAVGADEAHFNIDGWGGWIWPYRNHVAGGEVVRVRVTARNPYDSEERLTLRLCGPSGGAGSEATIVAGPRAEVSCELSIVPGGPCHRKPIAAELLVGSRSFGQVCEALVSVGGYRF